MNNTALQIYALFILLILSVGCKDDWKNLNLRSGENEPFYWENNKLAAQRLDMQYLYEDGDLYNFMNVENYEQLALNKDIIGDALKFVKENEICKVCSYNGNVFSVEPPLFVELEITDTEPGFKGDTATGASKPATVETGATVSVPLFVNTGDKIKIDTRTGEYLSRV